MRSASIPASTCSTRSLPNSRARFARADLTRCRSTRSCTACRCSMPSCKRLGRTRSLRWQGDDSEFRQCRASCVGRRARTRLCPGNPSSFEAGWMRDSQARARAARNYLGALMEKLIITVACDSRTSYPHNHLCPPPEDIPGVAQQYIDAVNAGAAIAHIHGRRTLEETIQADGRQVSRIHHADWKRLQDAIMNKVDPIMQFGVASARIEEKIKLMELGPDMMAVCFNAHDEYFQPEPSLPPKRMMAIHPVEELMAYAKAAEEHKVKLECECFTTGAFWHLEFVRKQGYLRESTYTTLFIGWPGGTWTPPTERALQFMVDNLPQNCIWNVSVMNPQKQWPILALAVALGGHVRVGYEDNPYIAPGEFAKNNAVLVERMASIARGLGREIATPDEARKILGLTRAQ